MLNVCSFEKHGLFVQGRREAHSESHLGNISGRNMCAGGGLVADEEGLVGAEGTFLGIGVLSAVLLLIGCSVFNSWHPPGAACAALAFPGSHCPLCRQTTRCFEAQG